MPSRSAAGERASIISIISIANGVARERRGKVGGGGLHGGAGEASRGPDPRAGRWQQRRAARERHQRPRAQEGCLLFREEEGESPPTTTTLSVTPIGRWPSPMERFLSHFDFALALAPRPDFVCASVRRLPRCACVRACVYVCMCVFFADRTSQGGKKKGGGPKKGGSKYSELTKEKAAAESQVVKHESTEVVLDLLLLVESYRKKVGKAFPTQGAVEITSIAKEIWNAPFVLLYHRLPPSGKLADAPLFPCLQISRPFTLIFSRSLALSPARAGSLWCGLADSSLAHWAPWRPPFRLLDFVGSKCVSLRCD